jgi:hypothetical protein
MESVDLDMEEIFDEDDPDEDIGAASRVLPDLADATQSQENDEEGNLINNFPQTFVDLVKLNCRPFQL